VGKRHFNYRKLDVQSVLHYNMMTEKANYL